MKKLLTILFALFTITLLAQQPDTVVVQEPGGFAGFYEKYSGAIWMILGLIGVTAFLTYRTTKVRDALNVIIDAAQDGRVTEVEFQAIVKAIKEIWGKKES